MILISFKKCYSKILHHQLCLNVEYLCQYSGDKTVIDNQISLHTFYEHITVLNIRYLLLILTFCEFAAMCIKFQYHFVHKISSRRLLPI